MILDIKENINKIDFELKKLFENVYISETANKNNFLFTIKANKMFLFEGCKKRVEVRVNINKTDLNTNIIKWNYLVNPLDENSDKIERISYLQNIANDIYEIASNKKMVNEYFTSLESHVDLITESNTNIEVNNYVNIIDICKKYNKFTKIIGDLKPNGFIELYSESQIKMSDKFKLENELLKTQSVEHVSFNQNIKITLK